METEQEPNYEEMTIEELDAVIEDSTSQLILDVLQDTYELQLWSYGVQWLVFGLLFFVVFFVAMGVGKK